MPQSSSEKPVTLHPRGILFDMDGVLVSSLGSVERAWAHWARERGIDPEQAIRTAHGRRAIETVRLLRPDLNDEEELRWLEKMEIADTEGLEILHGVRPILASLPEKCWTVVTSATEKLARSRMEHGGVPVPARIVTADMVTHGKPHPEPYQKGAALLGLTPAECLVIEDSASGARAGRAAGCSVLATLFSHSLEALIDADWIVRSLEDVAVRVDGNALEVHFTPVAREAAHPLNPTMAIPVRVEYAHHRRLRTRNTRRYRAAHWPIWIWVFFLAPGPLTFDLFERGGSRWNLLWLAVVLVGTGIAAFRGELPGAEAAPYILRFTEDRPNPYYRRICYTFAWNALLNFALLNLAGLIWAVATGQWRLKQIYSQAYPAVLILVLLLGVSGILPRVRRSTQGEGIERRYFYGAVWAVTAAQTILLILWKTLPKNHATDIAKLLVYCAVLAVMATLAAFGILPRTRPILPGELMVAD